MDDNSITKGKDYISHYGVKGQKWGVRRSVKQLAKNQRKSASKNRAKQAKSLNDAELKARVERLRLEREYVTISKQLDPAVKAHVSKFTNQAAGIAVGSATSAAVGFALKKIFTK